MALHQTAAVYFCLAVFPAIAEPQEQVSEQVPRFEFTGCEGSGRPAEENVDCGWLLVKENRDDPGSRELWLAVDIFRSHSPAPKPDPVVYLPGGPGAAALALADEFLSRPFWKELRENRDIVIYDQRGTGYSEPAFCPELDLRIRQLGLIDMPGERRRELGLTAFRRCREKLLQEGLDFGAYNSTTLAQDLEDLRQSLGFDKLNLVAESYGTRVALTAMRDAPESVRGAILISPGPPNARFFENAPARLTEVLDLVFQSCDGDPACQRAFPSLEEDFYALLNDLERDPLMLSWTDARLSLNEQPVGVDGTALAQLTMFLFYHRGSISVLPLMVREARRGNGDAIKALLTLTLGYTDYVDLGSQLTVMCYEAVPFEDPEKVKQQQELYPRLGPLYQEAWIEEQQAICNSWHGERAGPAERSAVASEIPALVLAGELDFLTPPASGQLTARTLANARLIEMPGFGHDAAVDDADCTPTLIKRFVDDPMRPLDASCASALPPLQLITSVHVNRGFSRLISQLYRDPDAMVEVWSGAVVLPLLSGVVVWPLAALIRRLLGKAPVSQGPETVARKVAGVTALLALAFVAGLAMVVTRTMEEDPFVLAFGVPSWAAPLFWLPWVVAPLTIAAAFFAAKAWREKFWGIVGRAHYWAVVSGCLGFVIFVIHWELW